MLVTIGGSSAENISGEENLQERENVWLICVNFSNYLGVSGVRPGDSNGASCDTSDCSSDSETSRLLGIFSGGVIT